jgi:hypothetical protein
MRWREKEEGDSKKAVQALEKEWQAKKQQSLREVRQHRV